ncbi:S-layer homology domain-containing protein [Candidatus Peregrinibacteria bacterium]|nr:S-layer homology domain-containing protein [Candidatus Peregrinibacteria bacterium]
MKIQKLFATVLTLVFLSIPLAPVSAETAETSSGIKAVTDFQDVLRTHSNYVSISYLNEAGVINGYSDGTFKPENPINRAEVLKIILMGSGVEVPEDFGEVSFPDFQKTDWFARFVMKAKALGIVKGDDADGTFAPSRQVNKAEFLKMLLMANNIKIDAVQMEDDLAPDAPKEAWFAPYLNYAFQVGIITKNEQGLLEPAKPLTRAEVADMMYLLILIKGSKDTQFLLHRAEAELAQIEVYIAANKVLNAKRASELAVDLTQQAYRNMPDNNVVLGAAKLSRAYDWLVDAFVLGIQKDYTGAAEWANKAIDKATEAWEVNNATQPIARHIKDRAREILAQVGGQEE